jgi:hypothetical protein
MTIPAYPLQWPAGWQRTESWRRKSARFSTSGRGRSNRQLTVYDAVIRVREVLEKMAIDDVVVSTNLKTKLDGFPASNQPEPGDRGAAVYWRTKSGETRCMAIDIYDRVADNLAAVAATLDAMRAIERHGGASVLDRAFTGFAALPDQSEDWTSVLGVPAGAPRAAVDEAYRRLRSSTHPDRGGSPEAFQRVQRAYERATA